jgi:hypothetical protein
MALEQAERPLGREWAYSHAGQRHTLCALAGLFHEWPPSQPVTQASQTPAEPEPRRRLTTPRPRLEGLAAVPCDGQSPSHVPGHPSRAPPKPCPTQPCPTTNAAKRPARLTPTQGGQPRPCGATWPGEPGGQPRRTAANWGSGGSEAVGRPAALEQAPMTSGLVLSNRHSL